MSCSHYFQRLNFETKCWFGDSTSSPIEARSWSPNKICHSWYIMPIDVTALPPCPCTEAHCMLTYYVTKYHSTCMQSTLNWSKNHLSVYHHWPAHHTRMENFLVSKFFPEIISVGLHMHTYNFQWSVRFDLLLRLEGVELTQQWELGEFWSFFWKLWHWIILKNNARTSWFTKTESCFQ